MIKMIQSKYEVKLQLTYKGPAVCLTCLPNVRLPSLRLVELAGSPIDLVSTAGLVRMPYELLNWDDFTLRDF